MLEILIGFVILMLLGFIILYISDKEARSDINCSLLMLLASVVLLGLAIGSAFLIGKFVKALILT